METEDYVKRDYPFYMNVAALESNEAPEILELILSDDVSFNEMFNMGERFIREQYENIFSAENEQSQFYSGTLQHRQNLRETVYYGIIRNYRQIDTFVRQSQRSLDPDIKDYCRKIVINSIILMCEEHTDLQNYFKRIHFGGIMSQQFPDENDQNRIIMEIMTVFDEMYVQKTGDKSLFDLSENMHLHYWTPFVAPMNYWSDESNIENAIYHSVTELYVNTGHEDRQVAMQAFLDLSRGWKDSKIKEMGLDGLFNTRNEIRFTVTEFFNYFDKRYISLTGNKGLFDKTQNEYLEVTKRGLQLRIKN
jgi:hypothetical protein